MNVAFVASFNSNFDNGTLITIGGASGSAINVWSLETLTVNKTDSSISYDAGTGVLTYIVYIRMGVWDLTCVICGAVCDQAGNRSYPQRQPSDDFERGLMETQKIICKKKYDWLDKILILLKRSNLVVSGEVDTGSASLMSNKYPRIETIEEQADEPDEPFGVPCHKACHQVLKKYLKHNIRFSDIAKRVKWSGVTNLKWGIMKKYQSQFFDFEAILEDNNEWLIESPLKNVKNRERILKLWRPIISKLPKPMGRTRSRSRSRSRPGRKSPAESATDFKIGTKRKGLDGNMWIIKSSGKSQRWMKCRNR